jgi:hypothetical protein
MLTYIHCHLSNWFYRFFRPRYLVAQNEQNSEAVKILMELR